MLKMHSKKIRKSEQFPVQYCTFEPSAIRRLYLAEPLAEPNAEHFNRFEQFFQPNIAEPSDEGVRTVGREQAYCFVTGKSLQEKLE